MNTRLVSSQIVSFGGMAQGIWHRFQETTNAFEPGGTREPNDELGSVGFSEQ